MTRDERQRQHTLLELLVNTGEQYQREIECERELFQVIALDAKGIPQSRITAKRATSLLSDAAKAVTETPASVKTAQRNAVPAKDAVLVMTDAQSVAVKH